MPEQSGHVGIESGENSPTPAARIGDRIERYILDGRDDDLKRPAAAPVGVHRGVARRRRLRELGFHSRFRLGGWVRERELVTAPP